MDKSILEEKLTLPISFPDQDLWSTIGNTPLIRLQRLTDGFAESVEIYGKAEWFNPGSSVKDRPAAAILSKALSNGLLKEDRVFLDSSSGNMGIAYATLGAPLGIRVHIAIPSNAGPERLTILRALGAELTLTDPLEGSEGARVVAAEMAAENPSLYYYANQYSNPANWQAHYTTTGPEILSQTNGRVTHFVAGLGTTGTLMGTGRYLREVLPDIRLVAVQPDGPIHGLEGLKHLPTSNVPEIYEPTLPDETIPVTTEQAYEMVRRLGKEEGLFVGISAAAAVVAALNLAKRIEEGVIVVILPDSGMKYLHQPIWDVK
ncbi:MAG TPA: cysteine synthase family protein [Anaerolineae bacterium]|nr:cysteine synthase family protein [Anaerolineae bacterium]